MVIGNRNSTLTVGVAGVGSLAVEDHGRVMANFGIRVNGRLLLADGALETGSLVVAASGFLAGTERRPRPLASATRAPSPCSID